MKHAYIVIAVLVLGLVMIVGCFPVDESVDSTAPTRRAIVEKESPVPTTVPAPTIADFERLEKQVTALETELAGLQSMYKEISSKTSQDNCHTHSLSRVDNPRYRIAKWSKAYEQTKGVYSSLFIEHGHGARTLTQDWCP